MRGRTLLLLLLVSIGVFSRPTWSAEQGPGKDYIIGPGDVIEIAVRQDPKMTRSVPVLPDGKIALPMVGQVMAGGKTVDELKADLEKEIGVFIPDPFVTVGVSAVNSMVIYVLGTVNTPGPITLTQPVNVLQAIALAGGLADFAKENKIKIFREDGESKTVFEFRYGDVARGKNMEQNIRLKRGDVIIVP
jgi:polysaccharide export outer membrane protein